MNKIIISLPLLAVILIVTSTMTTIALGQSDNASSSGAEEALTIVSLGFLPDGTGWLTVDNNGTLSPVTRFTHALTTANGYTIYNNVPFFTSNGTQVPLNTIDFSSQITIDPNSNVTLPAKPKIAPGVELQYGTLPSSSTPPTQQLQQPPTVEEWNPMEPGPIPTPPPTSDPDLIKFNELFAQCKEGQDKIVSFQGNSFDHERQNGCILAMRNAIAQFCENFQTYDAAKCEYVNRQDVNLFLAMNDRLLGFGETPTMPPFLLPQTSGGE